MMCFRCAVMVLLDKWVLVLFIHTSYIICCAQFYHNVANMQQCTCKGSDEKAGENSTGPWNASASLAVLKLWN